MSTERFVLLPYLLLFSSAFISSTTSPLGAIGVLTGESTACAASWQDAQQGTEVRWSRSGSDWPHMLNAGYDLASEEKGLELDWQAKPRLVWHRTLGAGYGNGVTQSGRFFIADRVNGHERLQCLHAETGAVLWSFQEPVDYVDAYGYNAGPRCSPVADIDRVYLYGVAGNLTCLDLQTGRKLWGHDLNAKYNVPPNFFGVGASPLVYQDRVIVMVGGTDEKVSTTRNNIGANPKPNGSAMVAFDRQSGKELYRTGDYLASYSAPIIANLEGRDWCLALLREGLMVFDPMSGQEADFFPFRSPRYESVNAASPVILDGQILISETYDVGSARLGFTNGKLQLLWRDAPVQKMQILRAHWATPIVIGKHLFASHGRNPPDADLRSLDWSANEVNWVERTRDRATLIRVDQHLLLLGEYGELQLLNPNPKKFERLGRYDLSELIMDEKGGRLVDAPTWAPLVYSHGYLYLRAPKSVLCFDMRSALHRDLGLAPP